MSLLNRLFALIAILVAAAFTGAVQAQNRTVVVELYTSQGCSSCPPADAILAELSEQPDVIALGLHVHYWDYLGWKDGFAQKKFARRQEYLNMHIPSRYRRVTPQMIFNGQTQVAGARPELIAREIQAMRAQPALADLDMNVSGRQLQLRLAPLSSQATPSDIHLVHYIPNAVVPIEKGENRGRTMRYANIVSSWETIGQWNGRSPINITYSLQRDEPFAVLVQGRNFGPIYVARNLD